MTRKSFEYGNREPVEEEHFGADSDGVTWTEQTLYKFNPTYWRATSEHAKGHTRHQSDKAQAWHTEREVRLLHRDGTSAWNMHIDYVPENESPVSGGFDWNVELPEPVDGVIGYILPKADFHDRIRVTNTIDAVRGRLASVNIREALNGFGLIEQVNDDKGNVWIVEREQDGSLRKLVRKGKDSFTVSKMPSGTFHVVSKQEELSFDSEDVHQMLDELNELYPKED